MTFSEGCPAGIHQGRIGAKPAASTNVSIFLLSHPFILGIALAFLTFCQTKISQINKATAIGIHPYMEVLRSAQAQPEKNRCPGWLAAIRGSKNQATNPFTSKASSNTSSPVNCIQ